MTMTMPMPTARARNPIHHQALRLNNIPIHLRTLAMVQGAFDSPLKGFGLLIHWTQLLPNVFVVIMCQHQRQDRPLVLTFLPLLLPTHQLRLLEPLPHQLKAPHHISPVKMLLPLLYGSPLVNVLKICSKTWLAGNHLLRSIPLMMRKNGCSITIADWTSSEVSNIV